MMPKKRSGSHDSVEHGRRSPVGIVCLVFTVSRLCHSERVMVR